MKDMNGPTKTSNQTKIRGIKKKQNHHQCSKMLMSLTFDLTWVMILPQTNLTASAANDVASHQGDWISGGDSRSWRLGGNHSPVSPVIGVMPLFFGILC